MLLAKNEARRRCSGIHFDSEEAPEDHGHYAASLPASDTASSAYSRQHSRTTVRLEGFVRFFHFVVSFFPEIRSLVSSPREDCLPFCKIKSFSCAVQIPTVKESPSRSVSESPTSGINIPTLMLSRTNCRRGYRLFGIGRASSYCVGGSGSRR